ncbi:MAG: threonine--tRNA ligase, partial [Eubacteriales bacterium]|nr:threonine--tRNA ligase [Eubacteriales bacterium]
MKEVKALYPDGHIEVAEDALKVVRHSTAHVLAQAVQRLYPGTTLTIGPAIDNGFYYDVDCPVSLSDDDLPKIEAEMKKIVKEKHEVTCFILPREEALAYVDKQGEPFKRELIEDMPEDTTISFYTQGEFTDLCGGPHVLNTKDLGCFKLMSLAGAYWRGDEKNKMLTRIYGTAWLNKEDLKNYLKQLEEAKKRDHRKLGRELKLFTLMEEGPGFPFYLPNGKILFNRLQDYMRELLRRENYLEISTPTMLHQQLWERSGHWDHYKDNMYLSEIDKQAYAIKPMNCPGCFLVYNHEQHSYRDLPLRLSEMGLVHRYELSGALHGLVRVRAFTQDDAHIFMRPDQISDEVLAIIRLIGEIYEKFGFSYKVELSTRPEDSMGTEEEWAMATEGLQSALDRSGVPYTINEGDGAFYGPKIDFHLLDAIGRSHQCGTIQLDLQLPQRFEASYIGADGEKHRPIVLHRAIYGSLDRFIAILIEHYAGKFPFWLAPEQVKILPISDKLHDYAEEVYKQLKQAGIRVSVDKRDEKLGYKIRQGTKEKIPFLLIVGEREAEQGLLSVRSRDEGELGTMSVLDFLSMAQGLNEEGHGRAESIVEAIAA